MIILDIIYTVSDPCFYGSHLFLQDKIGIDLVRRLQEQPNRNEYQFNFELSITLDYLISKGTLV